MRERAARHAIYAMPRDISLIDVTHAMPCHYSYAAAADADYLLFTLPIDACHCAMADAIDAAMFMRR